MFVFMSVAEDHANHCTDMVLLYSKASLVPMKIYNLFWGGYINPQIEISPGKKSPNPYFKSDVQHRGKIVLTIFI